MGVGNRGFKKCQKSTNCYTTTRRSKLRDPKQRIDAIVFHGVGLDKKELEILKEKRAAIPEFNQGVDPLYVLFILVSFLGFI